MLSEGCICIDVHSSQLVFIRITGKVNVEECFSVNGVSDYGDKVTSRRPSIKVGHNLLGQP